ncbi:hypothetical protein RI129_012213 [Pyrocoelia pectoralis]|uniref:lactoylglutathione lyase n=1 Tax=Pyrocoelia pectoralis TaxID=417401 RepID=A0AAN7UYP1_9COLE
MADTIPITDDEALKLCREPEAATQDFIFQQTMYRIKDPRKSIPFYTGVLGMRLLLKRDFPDMKFTLYFMGFEDPNDIKGELSSHERTEWAMGQKATLELTHNWGTEDDPNFKGYHNGNSEPRGFGHIGLMVPDVDRACERFESLGVTFIKRPQDGKMKTIAFISDPDGYWIEILCNKNI